MVGGNTLTGQLDIAASGSAGVTVGYVFLMAGLNDSFANVAGMQQAVSDTIAHAVELFPGRGSWWVAGPAASPPARMARRCRTRRMC